MQMPPAATLLQQYYNPATGEAVDESNPDFIRLLEGLSTYDGDVPQVMAYGMKLDDACAIQANDFARANPDVAKRIGHNGLFRIMVACAAEFQEGTAPTGYTTEVMTLAVETFGQPQPNYWLYGGIAAGVGVLALVLLRK